MKFETQPRPLNEDDNRVIGEALKAMGVSSKAVRDHFFALS